MRSQNQLNLVLNYKIYYKITKFSHKFLFQAKSSAFLNSDSDSDDDELEEMRKKYMKVNLY